MTPNQDPITLEIIHSALQATSDEMFAALRKTAMSAIIYEVLDMATGITDGDGNLASTGAGIPAFVGVLDKAVGCILERHDRALIRPGDVYMTNDPYTGGVTHLNDVVLAMPVFSGGEIVAWTANIAHWNDVGGMTPGSMSTEATEIYQEGIRLPAVKLIDGGRPIASVIEILKANSRLPDYLEGDMWAGIAAVRVGERQILRLIEKYGRDTFLAAMAAHMDLGEKATLKALAGLPKGTFTLEEPQDDGALWRVAVEIRDDAFIVDLRDNSGQDPRSNNVSADGSRVAAQMIVKSVTDPQSPANAGTFRPLDVLTRPGSVFHPLPPAANSFYFETEVRLYDLIWRCLAPHLPERVSAGHFGSICGTVIGGRHPDTGRHYTIVEPQLGGWGAIDGGDGVTAMFSGFHGDTFNCPAEISEARNGLYVDRMELNDAPGGEGRYRGGKGIRMDYRIRSDDAFLTCGYTRSKEVPWGMSGGRDGSTNYIEVRRTDGTVERHAYTTALSLKKDDVVRIVTGTGGGFGAPEGRDPARVRADVREGYLTPQRAKEVYGVEV